MKPKITREYEKDRHRNNEDEADFREFVFVDGKKVYKHGHWEYLYDEIKPYG